MSSASFKYCARQRDSTFISLLRVKKWSPKNGRGGAAGGRAATPFAAEREELTRGRILEELLDGLIDFFRVL